jgi:hypothetical protein
MCFGAQVAVAVRPAQGASCTVLSLNGLLEYGVDDVKEGTFEVSVCAELLREALQARFGASLLAGCTAIEAQERQARRTSPSCKLIMVVGQSRPPFCANSACLSQAETGLKGP